MVSLNIYKNSANKFGRKTGFKIENEIEDQDQAIPKLIGILTQVFCTFGPNLVILAWTGNELSCRQAQNGVTFDFEVKFDFEGQSQSPPQNNRNLNQGLLHLWSKFGDPSLNGWWVIARTSKRLPHTRTDGRTHRHTQATTIPEGQNWPRVKTKAVQKLYDRNLHHTGSKSLHAKHHFMLISICAKYNRAPSRTTYFVELTPAGQDCTGISCKIITKLPWIFRAMSESIMCA